ncbi:MAG: hypothetical protein ACYCVW_16580 [Rhodocyclaceae bacterium]
MKTGDKVSTYLAEAKRQLDAAKIRSRSYETAYFAFESIHKLEEALEALIAAVEALEKGGR